MTPRRHMMLGLLFLGAIGILSYYTLFKTDFSLFEEKQELTVYAEDARGLRKGSPVLYAGVRWGKVTAVVPDLDQPRAKRVKIDLVLDQPIKLFDDKRLTIESASVLGGVQLGIDPGDSELAEVDPALTELVASSPPDVLAALGEVVEENREPLRRALSGIDQVVASLNATEGTLGRLINDEKTADDLSNALAALQGTMQNTLEITDELRTNRGTIGKLIYDTDLYEELRSAVKSLDEFSVNAGQVLDDARNVEGPIGTLVYDKEFARNIKDTGASIASAAKKIDEGDGTIAKLINDDGVVKRLEGLLDTFGNPDGTIGRLMNDPALYDRLDMILADVADATRALREQRGPLGMLFYDTKVRDQLVQAVRVLTGGLEEQREAAPIATFLSTVFLGF